MSLAVAAFFLSSTSHRRHGTTSVFFFGLFLFSGSLAAEATQGKGCMYKSRPQ